MIKTSNTVNLKDNLIFAGTIYDSFEALEEAMGKLKLERPLFLLYLAKKAYAEEVFAAAGEQMEEQMAMDGELSSMPIEIPACRYHNRLQ